VVRLPQFVFTKKSQVNEKKEKENLNQRMALGNTSGLIFDVCSPRGKVEKDGKRKKGVFLH